MDLAKTHTVEGDQSTFHPDLFTIWRNYSNYCKMSYVAMLQNSCKMPGYVLHLCQKLITWALCHS